MAKQTWRQSPRVLTGEAMNAFECMVMEFVKQARDGRHVGADTDLANAARKLCATYVDRCFWDRRKK